ncbi:PD-(D/E)XK nuclease family protein, partial [Acetomicrobium hydrogeniformans]
STEWERQLPPFTINDVSFRGRADRIDHLKEIGQILWDYKTAGSKNYENSLQLASYALALSKADQKTGGAFYLCHSDSMCLGHISKEHKDLDKRLVPEGYSDNIKIKREKLEDIAKRAEEQLISWAKDLTSGSFEPHYDRKTCKDCQYKVLCRKSEIEGGEWLENGEQ